MTKKKPLSAETGSVLVLSSFLLVVITLVTVSYWKLLQMRIQITDNKKQEMRAYFAARAGIEDSISEFVQGHTWAYTSGNLSPEWVYKNDTTFYKTNKLGSSLDYFNYPVTISVTVQGDINTETITVNSQAQISRALDQKVYQKNLQASLIKSLSGDIIIHSLSETNDG